MSDGFWYAFWVAFFSGLPGIITAAVTAWIAYSQFKLADKVEVIHKATNSLTDRLVETTKVEAHAAGVKEEKDKKE